MNPHSYKKKNTYEVEIHLKPSSRTIDHRAVNTYEKGSFYCVEDPKGKVYKYPVNDIWRIKQDMKSSTKEKSLEEAFDEVEDG